jgi:hypothetical protein
MEPFGEETRLGAIAPAAALAAALGPVATVQSRFLALLVMLAITMLQLIIFLRN